MHLEELEEKICLFNCPVAEKNLGICSQPLIGASVVGLAPFPGRRGQLLIWQAGHFHPLN
jgi:hypothetical protein